MYLEMYLVELYDKQTASCVVLQSEMCYIKAAVPQILDLLKTHFEYVPKSDNNRYVTALENVIYNIYSHKCIPEINEEEEVTFVSLLLFISVWCNVFSVFLRPD